MATFGSDVGAAFGSDWDVLVESDWGLVFGLGGSGVRPLWRASSRPMWRLPIALPRRCTAASEPSCRSAWRRVAAGVRDRTSRLTSQRHMGRRV
jgi:hypothetical protein